MGMLQWLEGMKGDLKRIVQELFEHPETAGEEYFASECLSRFLEQQGFSVKCGVGGLDTAFSASWGTSRPVIGLLAEYDSLPALGQQPVPYREKREGNGHGCGHNLLGAGIVAAGCGLKAELEEQGIPRKNRGLWMPGGGNMQRENPYGRSRLFRQPGLRSIMASF